MDHDYIPLRACPVCNNRSGKVLGRLAYALFDNLEISGTKTMICCDMCGMRYDDIAFSEEQLQEYYRCNEHYAASSIGGGGGVSDDNNERYDRIIDALKPDTNDLILDYGSGQGGFIARCLRRGLMAFGIEASAKSREVAKISGLPIYESMKSFLAHNPSSKIHAVVFSHVLEHLIDPSRLLRMFAQRAMGTRVYLEVPDADSYLLPHAVRWPEMHFEHLSHFRQQDLAELAKHAGIKILMEDEVPFSKYLKDTRCRLLVGTFSGIFKKTDTIKMADYQTVSTLPSLAINNMPPDGHPLALWGISQYAMLLIGNHLRLTAPDTRLFDASPAKIGRSIKGIVIESADRVGSLSDDVHLLIPQSNSLPQMLRQLSDTGFRGIVRII